MNSTIDELQSYWAFGQESNLTMDMEFPKGLKGRGRGAENFGLSFGVETRIFYVLGSQHMNYWLGNEILGEN
jgi:hypothetical protein